VYALERIARESAHDRPTIGEVLTSFVRSRSPWPPSRPGQFIADAPIGKLKNSRPMALTCNPR
jgi:hypothetical protein